MFFSIELSWHLLQVPFTFKMKSFRFRNLYIPKMIEKQSQETTTLK
jgi:hypothetical protein